MSGCQSVCLSFGNSTTSSTGSTGGRSRDSGAIVWNQNSDQTIEWTRFYFGSDPNLPLEINFIDSSVTRGILTDGVCTERRGIVYSVGVVNSGTATIKIPTTIAASSANLKLRISNVKTNQCIENSSQFVAIEPELQPTITQSIPSTLTQPPIPTDSSSINNSQGSNNRIFPTSFGGDIPNSDDRNPNNPSLIIGAVIGSILALILVLCFIFFVLRRRRHRTKNSGRSCTKNEKDPSKSNQNSELGNVPTIDNLEISNRDSNDMSLNKTSALSDQQLGHNKDGTSPTAHDDNIIVDDPVNIFPFFRNSIDEKENRNADAISLDSKNQLFYNESSPTISKEYTFPTPTEPMCDDEEVSDDVFYSGRESSSTTSFLLPS